MNNINLSASDFNMKNLLTMRYDEGRGIVKIYSIRGILVEECMGTKRVIA